MRIYSLIIAWYLVSKKETLLFVKSLSPTLRNTPAIIRFTPTGSVLHLSGTNEGDGEKEDEIDAHESKKKEKLRFGGKQRYQSNEIPLPANIRSLHHFFAMRENQHVLLTGGKTGSEIEEISLHDPKYADIDILDRWEKNALLMGGDEPNPNEDVLVKVKPPGISIFVVEVCPETIIGSKIISISTMSDMQAESSQIVMPEYQAVLIQDYPRASGPKPLVWLFNKIIYGGKPSDNLMSAHDESSARNEKALLRVWAQPSMNGTFVFAAEAEIRLEFSFPKLLLRFFPMNKEKAEGICNDAIEKALALNLLPAIDMFTNLYMKQMNVERICERMEISR